MNTASQTPAAPAPSDMAPAASQMANAPAQMPTQQSGAMPGQAAPMGIAQLLSNGKSSNPSTPTGISPQLSTLPKQLLQAAIMGEGGTGVLPIAALAELSKRLKAEKMAMAQQGQAAQQATQGMQPLKDQILAASGIDAVPRPPMQLANGGIVAFEGGGITDSQEAQDRAKIVRGLEEMGYGANKLLAAGLDIFTMPIRALAGVYNTVIRAPRAFGLDVPFVPKEFGTESMTPYSDRIQKTPPPTDSAHPASAPGRERGAQTYPPGSPVAPVQGPAPADMQGGAGSRMRVSVSGSGSGSGSGGAPGGIAALPVTKPFVSDLSEVNAATAAQKQLLEQRRNLPENVLKGRGTVDELMSSMIMQDRAESEKMEREANAEKARVQDENSKPLLSDPRMLMAMAGGMSTKRGDIFGSLARGTGNELGRRADAIEAGRKEHLAAQKEVRLMNQNIRQRQVLEQQRKLAVMEKDFDRISQIDDAINKLDADKAMLGVTTKRADEETTQNARKTASGEVSAQASMRSADAAMISAQAHKISAEVSKLGLRQDQEAKLKLGVMNHLNNDPDFKKLVTRQADIKVMLSTKPGNPALTNELRALEAEENRQIAKTAALVGVQMGTGPATQTSSIPGAAPAVVDKSKWGQPQVVKQ